VSRSLVRTWIPTCSDLDKHVISFLVLRAHNVPHIKTTFGGKREFFVTIAYQAPTRKTKRRTKSVQIEGETVVWDQRLDAL